MNSWTNFVHGSFLDPPKEGKLNSRTPPYLMSAKNNFENRKKRWNKEVHDSEDSTRATINSSTLVLIGRD
jgi:hypothetical protein